MVCVLSVSSLTDPVNTWKVILCDPKNKKRVNFNVVLKIHDYTEHFWVEAEILRKRHTGTKAVSRCSTLNNSENMKDRLSSVQTKFLVFISIPSRDIGIYNDTTYLILPLMRVKKRGGVTPFFEKVFLRRYL